MSPDTERPSPDEARVRTRQIRIAEDLGLKLAEIMEAEGGVTAAFLDPLIRPEIESRHRLNLPVIQAIRAAREAAAKAREKAFANDFGGEG